MQAPDTCISNSCDSEEELFSSSVEELLDSVLLDVSASFCLLLLDTLVLPSFDCGAVLEELLDLALLDVSASFCLLLLDALVLPSFDCGAVLEELLDLASLDFARLSLLRMTSAESLDFARELLETS